MLSFFKRKKKTPEVTPTQEVTSTTQQQMLTFHSSWDSMPQDEKYVYQFKNQTIEPLEVNHFGFKTLQIEQDDDYFYVTTIIQNYVDEDFTPESITLYLVNETGKVHVKRVFPLNKIIGPIPAFTNM